LAKKKETNPGFISEAEKQDLIWKAFGVDYSREINQLKEARERFLSQLKTNLMTDDVKSLIEDIVRDEVRRILKPKPPT
jgi:DNA gyrase/topoisomerase IV subunit B